MVWKHRRASSSKDAWNERCWDGRAAEGRIVHLAVTVLDIYPQCCRAEVICVSRNMCYQILNMEPYGASYGFVHVKFITSECPRLCNAPTQGAAPFITIIFLSFLRPTPSLPASPAAVDVAHELQELKLTKTWSIRRCCLAAGLSITLLS